MLSRMMALRCFEISFLGTSNCLLDKTTSCDEVAEKLVGACIGSLVEDFQMGPELVFQLRRNQLNELFGGNFAHFGLAVKLFDEVEAINVEKSQPSIVNLVINLQVPLCYGRVLED